MIFTFALTTQIKHTK